MTTTTILFLLTSMQTVYPMCPVVQEPQMCVVDNVVITAEPFVLDVKNQQCLAH